MGMPPRDSVAITYESLAVQAAEAAAQLAEQGALAAAFEAIHLVAAQFEEPRAGIGLEGLNGHAKNTTFGIWSGSVSSFTIVE
jgi:hypothetical protein